MAIWNNMPNWGDIFNNWTGTFKVTPDQLERQSESVSNSVAKIEHSFGEIEDIIKATASYWNGDAADLFRSTAEDFKDEVATMLLRMTEHVDDLKKMAGIYEKAEAEVQETIQSLPADVIV